MGKRASLKPRKILFTSHLSPGDAVLMTAAIRDLHIAHPFKFQTDVSTTAMEIWENNPYITKHKWRRERYIQNNETKFKFTALQPDLEIIRLNYPLVDDIKNRPYHFIHGYVQYLEHKLKIKIPITAFKGDIHISKQEKGWISQVEELPHALRRNFWIVAAGGKFDYTAKWWDPGRYQQVIDHFLGKLKFVQCISGDSSLLTYDGYQNVQKLWEKGGHLEFKGLDNLRQYGTQKIVNSHGLQTATNIYRTGDQDVYRITLKNGLIIEATSDHVFYKLPTRHPSRTQNHSRIKCNLFNIKIGDKIPLLLEDLPVQTPDPYSILAGWVVGDGHVIKLKDEKRSFGSQTASVACYGSDVQLLGLFRKLLIKLYPQSLIKFHNPRYLGQDILFEGKKIGKRIRSINLGRRLLTDGVIPGHKHKFPDSVWHGSGNKLAGFLLGLFSADGNVTINRVRNCCSISLSQSNNTLLSQCQLALLRLGITSSVLKGRKARKQQLSDGKGGKKLYNKKQEFILRITGKENCQKYMQKIGFLQLYKTNSFKTWFAHNSYIDSRSRIRPYSVIKDVKYIGQKPTFCLTEPTHNEIIINGLITGNCGERHHWHPPLSGVINLVGQTNTRQLIRLVYHAEGVLCPVTFLMHLAAAVPVKPKRPRDRACVVVAGGREDSQWEAYPQHQYIHTIGALPCCQTGGCWRSRCQLVGDGDEKDRENFCDRPVQVTHNVCIPECMHMIRTEDVVRRIEMYYECANNNRKYYE